MVFYAGVQRQHRAGPGAGEPARRRDRGRPRRLGCGSGEKLAVLAEAIQAAGRRARVHLIDISAAALEQSEQRLGRLEHVSVIEHRLTYEDGLRRASRRRWWTALLTAS